GSLSSAGRVRRRACSLSGIDGIVLRVTPGHDWESKGTKSWPGGPRPTLPGPLRDLQFETMSHHCVLCGAVLVPRVIEGREVEACVNDDFVLWHDPKVSTAVVIESGGGVVLGRRAIEPGRGLWCLPGGFINDDEAPWAAAARECMEEICVEV